MKVNLNIEEDELFRTHLRGLIEGQVRHILREQLSGIVAGEIAKLRLLQPNSTTLGDLVAAELKKTASSRVTATDVRDEIRRQISAAIAPVVKDIHTELKQQVLSGLKTVLQ